MCTYAEKTNATNVIEPSANDEKTPTAPLAVVVKCLRYRPVLHASATTPAHLIRMQLNPRQLNRDQCIPTRRRSFGKYVLRVRRCDVSKQLVVVMMVSWRRRRTFVTLGIGRGLKVKWDVARIQALQWANIHHHRRRCQPRLQPQI